MRDAVLWTFTRAGERLLSGDGHTVSTATNGLEALEKFQVGWFDVVVTDHAMPEMSGAELAANGP